MWRLCSASPYLLPSTYHRVPLLGSPSQPPRRPRLGPPQAWPPQARLHQAFGPRGRLASPRPAAGSPKNPSDSLEQTAENDARENYRRLLDCELDCDANSLEQFGALWSASAAARPLRSIVAQSWVTRESAFSWLSSAVTVSRSQPSTARIGWAAGAEMGIRRRDGQQAPRWAARIGWATGASLLQRSKNARRRRDAPRRRPRGTEEHLSQP
jgi:hypothetical protein